MNKFGMVFGLAAVATLAGCKDPDYARAPANPVQNTPVDVTTTTTTTTTEQTVVTTKVIPVAKCACLPGTRHTAPCACGDPNCKCIVETKSAPVGAGASADYTIYIVQNGDYLAKISKKFNVTISSIKRLNPSIKKDIVRVGQKIKIPGIVDVGVQTVPTVAGRSTTRRTTSSTYTGATKEYVVKNGDTLGSIAYGNGINIRQLKALNGLTSDSLKIGQKLKIPAEKVAKKPSKKAAAAKVAESVKPAETAVEPVGDAPTAAVPAQPAVSAAETNAATVVETPKEAVAAPATTTYVVQEGDDMTGVSIRFAVSAAEIRELNNMAEGEQLKPGTTIKLPAEAVQQ